MRYTIPIIAFVVLFAAAAAAQRAPVTVPVDPELEKQADHDLTAARFYFSKRKAYAGAKDRLLDIVDAYPDFTKIDEVYFLLGQCFEKTKEPARAREFYTRLLAERPQSAFAERARVRLGELPPTPQKQEP
jgi:TolA-binding protein